MQASLKVISLRLKNKSVAFCFSFLLLFHYNTVFLANWNSYLFIAWNFFLNELLQGVQRFLIVVFMIWIKKKISDTLFLFLILTTLTRYFTRLTLSQQLGRRQLILTNLCDKHVKLIRIAIFKNPAVHYKESGGIQQSGK